MINTNRTCYNTYYVPLSYIRFPQWPPTYITYDCGELAKHIVRFDVLPSGVPHFTQTRVWECPACGKRYSLPKGVFDFVLLGEDSK